ncbi:hypothetical protein EVAR_89288_1 [Eumeta japonica]|uniref:YEATS domain-containing protein n=1 Tax=Eumeta variegata TaxID=151549 RepID=A0A4C1YZ11_EUMVA|nr:hypothetical protein EVAR_89288_1 [Eumeta japonica]
MTAVKVNFEIGHKASIRAKKTPEGFTHDWEVFVRGQEGADISHFVEKVVFHLHATFPKPKRVVKEPPFSIKESGYAGFNLPIEIYLKNREEPKKIKFHYDLSLQEKGPTTYNLLKDRYSYNDDKSPLISKPKLSSDTKKHKSKEIKEEIPHRTNSFENLFGLPIQKPPKVSPDPKKIEKPIIAVKTEKKEKDCSNTEKQKSKHEHREIKTEKNKNKDNKVKIEKTSKSHAKELEKPKDKPPKRPNERPPSPDPPKKHCPSAPQRSTSPPQRSNSALSIKEEYKTPKLNVDNSDQKKPSKFEEKIPEIKVEKEVKEKKKKEKKSHDRDKEKKEKKDHKKDSHKPNKDSPKDHSKDISRLKELPKEKNSIKETPPPTPVKEKSSKIDKPFNKFSIENHIKTPVDTGERLEDSKIKDKNDQERKHKHKKKEKKRDESREKNKESAKEKKHKHDKIREAPMEKIENIEHRDMTLPKERPPPEPVSPISIDTASQCSSKSEIAKVSLVGGDIGNSSHSDSEVSLIVEEEQEKHKIENHSPEPPKERVPTPEPEPEPEPVIEPPVAQPHKEKSKKHKDKSAKREEKRRKRKAAEEEQESRKSIKLNESSSVKLDNEHGEGSGITTETKLQDNGVSSSLGEDGEPGQMSPDYMVQLRELQQRIMTIKSNEELERVVNLIAETGRYEVTTQTFDFDLCSLDRSTVQQLLQLIDRHQPAFDEANSTISEIVEWLSMNNLLLNERKTKLVKFSLFDSKLIDTNVMVKNEFSLKKNEQETYGQLFSNLHIHSQNKYKTSGGARRRRRPTASRLKGPRKKFFLQVIKKRPRKPDVADVHEWCSAATECRAPSVYDPRPVFAPRVRSRRITLQYRMHFIIMRLPGAPSSPTTLLCRGNPEGFQRFFAPLAPLCHLTASDEAVKAYGLTAGAVMFQGVFSPCESDTPRAPGRTDCP